MTLLIIRMFKKFYNEKVHNKIVGGTDKVVKWCKTLVPHIGKEIKLNPKVKKFKEVIESYIKDFTKSSDFQMIKTHISDI